MRGRIHACLHASLSMSSMMKYDEDDDGVQLCPMSASVTEQADSRFVDVAARAHTRTHARTHARTQASTHTHTHTLTHIHHVQRRNGFLVFRRQPRHILFCTEFLHRCLLDWKCCFISTRNGQHYQEQCLLYYDAMLGGGVVADDYAG